MPPSSRINAIRNAFQNTQRRKDLAGAFDGINNVLMTLLQSKLQVGQTKQKQEFETQKTKDAQDFTLKRDEAARQESAAQKAAKLEAELDKDRLEAQEDQITKDKITRLYKKQAELHGNIFTASPDEMPEVLQALRFIEAKIAQEGKNPLDIDLAEALNVKNMNTIAGARETFLKARESKDLQSQIDSADTLAALTAEKEGIGWIKIGDFLRGQLEKQTKQAQDDAEAERLGKLKIPGANLRDRQLKDVKANFPQSVLTPEGLDTLRAGGDVTEPAGLFGQTFEFIADRLGIDTESIPDFLKGDTKISSKFAEPFIMGNPERDPTDFRRTILLAQKLETDPKYEDYEKGSKVERAALAAIAKKEVIEEIPDAPNRAENLHGREAILKGDSTSIDIHQEAKTLAEFAKEDAAQITRDYSIENMLENENTYIDIFMDSLGLTRDEAKSYYDLVLEIMKGN